MVTYPAYPGSWAFTVYIITELRPVITVAGLTYLNPACAALLVYNVE